MKNKLSILLIIILAVHFVLFGYMIWGFIYSDTSGSWGWLGSLVSALFLPRLSAFTLLLILYIILARKKIHVGIIIFATFISLISLYPSVTLTLTRKLSQHTSTSYWQPEVTKSKNKKQLSENINEYLRLKDIFNQPQKIESIYGNMISIKNLGSFNPYGISQDIQNLHWKDYIEKEIIEKNKLINIRLPKYSKLNKSSMNINFDILLFDDTKLLNLLFLDKENKRLELIEYQKSYKLGKPW